VTSVRSNPSAGPVVVGTGRLAVQLVVPVGLVVLWWRTSANSDSYLYPPLTEVLGAFRDDWLFARFESDLVPSLGRFALGYLLAVALGLTVGTLLGLVPALRRSVQPLTELVRSVPPTLLFPLAIVTFGVGDDARVALITLGSLWPVLLNTVDGIRGVDPQVLEVARSFRIDRRMQVTRVILPAASPKIVAGMRIALSVALLLMVVSEMRGGTNGLGFQIRSAERSFDIASAYAAVIVIGIVGLVANLLFVVVERQLMRWHRGARGQLEGSGGGLA
jgi:ABC-type nitrate/sulfonate/bicarbonate transport system permease component